MLESIKIHPTAIVSSDACIGAGTVVGPYSLIGSGVTLGQNNLISSHVVIEGDTIIGDNNSFFSFSAIGTTPQVLKLEPGKNLLRIGNNNVFRENVTIQPGIEKNGGVTKIGNRNHFLISSHVAHDCFIGDDNCITNSSGLAGHVVIGNKVTIGGMVGIHQFVNLGDYSFIGGGSMVVKDVPPYCIAEGNKARLVHINTVGLLRSGFTTEQVGCLKKIFLTLFCSEGIFEQQVEEVSEKYADFPFTKVLVDFIQNSKRGITRRSKV